MKYFYLFLFVLFFACGGSEDIPPIEPPVAVNDSATTSENTSVSISVLSNDTLKNNATLDDFDTRSSNNGIITEASNRLIYTPADNFTGTDTFNYTICDGLSTPNCATATVTVTITDTGNPTAVDDAFEVTENTTTIITTLLENDTLLDAAKLISIDNTSSSGTVVLNDDGTVSYTALNGVSGEDTFTYTLCDNDLIPSCSTATVTITIIDEGNPIAVTDAYTFLKNQIQTISNVLDNDTLIDDSVLSTIDDSSTLGTVVLNSDGSLTYQPPTDYLGNDSFSYTLCDDDTPDNSCSTATVTITIVEGITFNIPSAIADYYNGVVFIDDSNIMNESLHILTEDAHTNKLEYIQRHNYLYDADADMTNANNVILIYSSESRFEEEYQGNGNYNPQTFNTEHVYPQSFLGDNEIAIADLHLLRVCDANINTERSNSPFVDGSGTYLKIGNGWYPGDQWRGDVARIIFYVNMYYEEPISDVGTLATLLEWNKEDPVSAFEEQRNTVIYAAQGNRNPFIDNPYLATLIWGGDAAENKWE